VVVATVARRRSWARASSSAVSDALHDAQDAFVHAKPKYLESIGFVLDPAGRVLVSVYSSNAIGRLVPDDVAGLIAYVRAPAAA